jgi:hypothetical protein
MDAYPWHRGRDVRLPREADDGRIGRAAEALRDAMNRAGVAPAGLRSRPMHVMEFNRTVVEYRNKAMTTALRVMDMLGLLWEAHGDRGVEAAVDKQGGRDRYAAWLASSFWGCRVRVMKESSLASAYEVSAAGRGMKVTFEPRAETRHFCVALASMVSKYVRELFMGMVNDYWLARVPGIRPTAGYVTDGRRFLSDIRAELQSDPALAEMLVRAC